MQPRYSPAQQVLHWITVLAMFAILPVAWVMTSVKEDTAPFYFWLDVHKSLGLTLLVLTLARIVWRLFDRPPALPARVDAWNRWSAHVVYAGLFAAMIVMPVSGYLWTTGHSHTVAPFNLIHFPDIAYGNRPLGDFAEEVHQWGQWSVYGLIGLHLCGVSYHLMFKQDGLLGRMLPPFAAEPRPE